MQFASVDTKPLLPSGVICRPKDLKAALIVRYSRGRVKKLDYPTHRLGEFLQLQQTQDLIAEIETAGIPAVRSKEGRGGGTFAGKELVSATAD